MNKNSTRKHTLTYPHTHARAGAVLFNFVSTYAVRSCSFLWREKPSNPVISHEWKSAGIGVGVPTPANPLKIPLCRPRITEHSADWCPRREMFILHMCRTDSRPTDPINWTVFLHIFIQPKLYKLEFTHQQMHFY